MTTRFEFAVILLAGIAHAGVICRTAQSEETQRRSSVFPLTQQKLEDESTLDETILSDVLITGTKDDPEKLRDVRVRFFSHDWKDGPWHGTVRVVIPEVIAVDRRGLVAMCPGSGDEEKTREGLGVHREFVENTARLLGIPVVSIPNMGEHFGESKIHPVSDRMLLKFVETKDPAWLPAFPFFRLFRGHLACGFRPRKKRKNQPTNRTNKTNHQS